MSLIELVDNSRSDINTVHSYLEKYHDILNKKKDSSLNVLQIGIKNGGNIKLWNDFFNNATIYALDTMNIDNVWDGIKNNNKIKLYTSIDPYSTDFFKYNLLNKKIKFDIVIDDGTHTLESMIQFIKLYSQLLCDDGILVIEDIQNAGWIHMLTVNVPEEIKQFVKVYDLRKNKNRYDDILFTIDKSNKN
jgi:hypothetical protein